MKQVSEYTKTILRCTLQELGICPSDCSEEDLLSTIAILGRDIKYREGVYDVIGAYISYTYARMIVLAYDLNKDSLPDAPRSLTRVDYDAMMAMTVLSVMVHETAGIDSADLDSFVRSRVCIYMSLEDRVGASIDKYGSLMKLLVKHGGGKDSDFSKPYKKTVEYYKLFVEDRLRKDNPEASELVSKITVHKKNDSLGYIEKTLLILGTLFTVQNRYDYDLNLPEFERSISAWNREVDFFSDIFGTIETVEETEKNLGETVVSQIDKILSGFGMDVENG